MIRYDIEGDFVWLTGDDYAVEKPALVLLGYTVFLLTVDGEQQAMIEHKTLGAALRDFISRLPEDNQ